MRHRPRRPETHPRRVVASCMVISSWGAVLLLLTILIATVACSTGSASTSSTPVRELRSISELQDRFNGDAGAIRLILLVSPT
jgi:hypothetical protein